jgi:hypothetical protein
MSVGVCREISNCVTRDNYQLTQLAAVKIQTDYYELMRREDGSGFKCEITYSLPLNCHLRTQSATIVC